MHCHAAQPRLEQKPASQEKGFTRISLAFLGPKSDAFSIHLAENIYCVHYFLISCLCKFSMKMRVGKPSVLATFFSFTNQGKIIAKPFVAKWLLAES